MIELIIIAVYFLAVGIIGLASHRKIWRMADFMVAGRRYASFFITGSLLATIIGGSATVGLAGLGFSRGISGAWWLLVGSVGLIFLGLFLAKKVRGYALYTLPAIIQKQYNHQAALAASVLIVVAWIGITAGQILAAGKIFSSLEIGTPVIWMIVFTIIFVGYTVAGGQYALIRTDILDIVIIFTGIAIGVGATLWQLGGINALLNALPSDKLAFPLSSTFGGEDLISYLLLIGLTYVVGPDIYARIFCAKDGRTARTSALWSAALIIPFAFGVTLIGMGALVLFPQISPEQAFPSIITRMLSPVAAGFVLAALLSAVMSSASATLWSASTILTENIIGSVFKNQKSDSDSKSVSLSRWGILGVGLASLGLALVLNGVINALLFAYTIYTCGVILPVIAGFYKDKLKITPSAAVVAIIGGGTAGLASEIWNIRYLDIGALLLNLFLLLAVSLVETRIRNRRLIARNNAL